MLHSEKKYSVGRLVKKSDLKKKKKKISKNVSSRLYIDRQLEGQKKPSVGFFLLVKSYY